MCLWYHYNVVDFCKPMCIWAEDIQKESKRLCVGKKDEKEPVMQEKEPWQNVEEDALDDRDEKWRKGFCWKLKPQHYPGCQSADFYTHWDTLQT